jgi:hypothetical protein
MITSVLQEVIFLLSSLGIVAMKPDITSLFLLVTEDPKDQNQARNKAHPCQAHRR